MSSALIEQIKDRISIEEILKEQGIILKKGRCRCPIHKGDNPTSFSFGRDWYHCFSCGASGDQFSLYMSIANCDFKTALSDLARMAGVPVPKASPAQSKVPFYPEKIVPQKLAKEQYKGYLKEIKRAIDTKIRLLETHWLHLRQRIGVSEAENSSIREWLWSYFDRLLLPALNELDSSTIYLNYLINSLNGRRGSH